MRAVLAIALLCAAGCAGGGREDRVDITGTVVAPKALVGSSVGMVYVGVWSELDAVTGAPAADAVLYGGNSSGSFTSLDQRTICRVIEGRTVRDAGANFEIDFVVPQVRFERGSVVWAFSDENLTSCNPNAGTVDNFQYLVDLLSATDEGGGFFRVAMEPASYSAWLLNGTVKADVELVDEGGGFWAVTALDDTSDTLQLTGAAGTPAVSGAQKARLYQRENPIPYGAQFEDVFDDPSSYLESGDVFSSSTAGSAILDSVEPLLLHLDTVLP